MLSPNPVPDRRPSDPDVPDLPDLRVEPRRPLLDLSLTQLVGSSLAAATGAALASGLGVAGTILGAACVSLVSAIAAAAYTQSLRTTRARVRTVAERRPPAGVPDPPAAPPRGRRLRPKAVLAGAGAVFVIAFASITGYELLTGQPISGGTGGTTLNEVTGTGQAAGRTAGERDDPEPDAPAGQSTPTSTTTGGSRTTGATSDPPTESSTPPSGSTSAPPSGTDPTPTPGPPPSTTPAPTTPPASPTG